MHPVPDALGGAEANIAPRPKLGNQLAVTQALLAELALTNAVGFAESFNFADQTLHKPVMGEISPTVNSRRGIFRESRHGRVLCDDFAMPDIDAIRAAIENAMAKKGFSRRSLSTAAGLSESAVRDLLTRTDNPGIGTLSRIADALEMPVDQLTGLAAMVPVMGNIGAGGEVLFETQEAGEDSLPTVPRPPLVSGRLMALRVMGASMLPKYEDGDIIYVRRDHDGILPSYLNRYCAVRTDDGGTYLKILALGSEPDRYTLRSLNAPDMENVTVLWASPVLFVMPRDSV